LLIGIEGFTTREDQEEIARMEKQIRRRFVVGSQVSEHAIVQDFIRQVRLNAIKINHLFEFF
jgi:DNA replication licensing factor MCM5